MAVFRALTKSLTPLQHDVQHQLNAFNCEPYAIALTWYRPQHVQLRWRVRDGIRQIFTSAELIPFQSGHRRAGLPRTIDAEIYWNCFLSGRNNANMMIVCNHQRVHWGRHSIVMIVLVTNNLILWFINDINPLMLKDDQPMKIAKHSKRQDANDQNEGVVKAPVLYFSRSKVILA